MKDQILDKLDDYITAMKIYCNKNGHYRRQAVSRNNKKISLLWNMSLE